MKALQILKTCEVFAFMKPIVIELLFYFKSRNHLDDFR